MSKPKLQVPEVWILSEVLPYEGTDLIGVFNNLPGAQSARPGRWEQRNDHWVLKTSRKDWEPYFVIHKEVVRTK